MEYFAESDDKAEAFVFCRERMEADMTTEAPRLKEMSRELSEKPRRFGGTGTKRAPLGQEAMNHIRFDRIVNRPLRPLQAKWTRLWKEVGAWGGSILQLGQCPAHRLVYQILN